MIGALRRLVGRHGPPAEPAEQAGPAGGVAVYVWRPRGAARNFGDETGPLVVGRLAERLTGRTPVLHTLEKGAPKLLTVGSILHKAAEGDCIWGAGVNGKTALGNLAGRPRLDIRAVRGPLTAELLERTGYAVPPVQGDPALLFPSLYGAEIDAEEAAVERLFPSPGAIFIPNLNEARLAPRPIDGVVTVSPLESPARIACIVRRARTVIASSLHGLVFADALSVPSRPVIGTFEPPFKYFDYYRGTGRDRVRLHATVEEALAGTDAPPMNWRPDPLVAAFPLALFTPEAR